MSAKTPRVARETPIVAPAPAGLPSTETALRIVAPPADAQVVAKGGSVAVWMPPQHAPGVRAFGDYRPGSVYHVDAAEALRLVTVKGFRFASMADHQAVSNHVDGIADAAASTPQE